MKHRAAITDNIRNPDVPGLRTASRACPVPLVQRYPSIGEVMKFRDDSLVYTHIQPRKHALDHAGYTAPIRQHELDHADHTDHTDQEYTNLPCLEDLDYEL